MSSLGYSVVSGGNHIVHPINGANSSNVHFTNSYGSMVGGLTGCGGAGSSTAALEGAPDYGYNLVKTGGNKQHRRGGYKRGQSKKRSCRCRGKCHCRKSKKRSCRCRGKCHCGKSKRRTMRGGLSALSPSSFSGAANAPYHQYAGGQCISSNYSLGAEKLPYTESALSSPPPINVNNKIY